MHALANRMERPFDNKPEVDNDDPSSSNQLNFSSDLPSHFSRRTPTAAHEDASNSCVVKISVPQKFYLGATQEALMAIDSNNSSNCTTPESKKQCHNSLPSKHEETNETTFLKTELPYV